MCSRTCISRIDSNLKKKKHQQLSGCPNEEENPQCEFVVKLDGDDIISGACRVPRRTPARPELVPAPRDFFASPAALMLGL